MPGCWGTQHWNWAAGEGSRTPPSWHQCPQCARDLGLAGSSSWQAASPCSEAPAQPSGRTKAWPSAPSAGPDKAPRLEVPILWQRGQMAGTKLWSSAVLWPGRALGKRCGARTLPAATRRVLPEDTTRRGSSWERKPGRGSGDNCQPCPLHTHPVTSVALTPCLSCTHHVHKDLTRVLCGWVWSIPSLCWVWFCLFLVLYTLIHICVP